MSGKRLSFALMLVLLVGGGIFQILTLSVVQRVGSRISAHYERLTSTVFAQDNLLTKVSVQIFAFMQQYNDSAYIGGLEDDSTITESARRIISHATLLREAPQAFVEPVIGDDPLFLESRTNAIHALYVENRSELVELHTGLGLAESDAAYRAVLDLFAMKAVDLFHLIADYSAITHQLANTYYAYLQTTTMHELKYQRVAVLISVIAVTLFAALFTVFYRYERAENHRIVRQSQLLEDVVSQRTCELKEANVTLRQEITKHKVTSEHHKQARDALQESKAIFERAEKLAHVGYWRLDRETMNVESSNELRSIFDLNDEAATPNAFVETVHPEDREYDLGIMRRGMEYGEGWDIEHRLLMKDDTVKYVRAVGRAITDESGKVTFLVGAVQDITDRKKADDDLRKSEERLRQAQKLESIGRLAGGVAHDFNNLLTTIIGYSDLISLEPSLGETTKTGVHEIKASARRAASLTQQLLAFSRKQVLQPQAIDLHQLINNLGSMLRRLIGEHIDLIITLDTAPRYVNADPGQMEQIVTNLVINAGDSMPKGGALTIETQEVYLDEGYQEQHPDVAPGTYIMMAVSDTGCGMDEETREQIFEPFFTTKAVGKGTGLGLSTVYGIVKQSGGFIWVYSERGQGTTFKIYLPRFGGKKGQVEEVTREAIPVGGVETILFVEDEDSLRKMVVRMLDDRGYSVIDANNGKEAIELLYQSDQPTIDLLVTDVIMPEMGGKELSMKLQKRYPKMKVLYISGYTDNSIVHHGVLDEGVAFLQKPFSPETLTEKIRAVLYEG
jgi:PAS domain S-box-containing protein